MNHGRYRNRMATLLGTFAIVALVGCGDDGDDGAPVSGNDGGADVDPGEGGTDADAQEVDADGGSEAGEGGEDQILEVTILHTTDTHNRANGYGAQRDYTPLDSSDSDAVLGGYARLATLVSTIRTEQESAGTPVLVVDSGDFLMGTVFDMTASDPVAMRYFSAVGYDAITLGNHEFDWSPAGLSTILDGALGADPSFDVPILASNTITDPNDAADDGLEGHMAAGVIRSKLVLELDNGLKVGLLGVVGEEADRDAPTAPPVTFDHDASFLQGLVDDLETAEGADMVLLLSHSGIASETAGGEEVAMSALTGVDVICSGHSHIPAPNAIESNGVVIVQPGYYGMWLGRIDVRFNVTQKRVESYDYEMIPVDDTVAGDATMQGVVDAATAEIDTQLEAALGLTTMDAVAEVDFALDRQALVETGVGNLVADALRTAATASVMASDDPTPFTLAIMPNGLVRDDLQSSAADGTVTFADLYNVLPLGMSPDPANQQLPGWPLVSMYLTAGELRAVAEVSTSLADIYPDAFLNLAGVRYVADSTQPWLQRVTTVTLCGNTIPTASGGDEDIFSLDCETSLDLNDTTTLYRAVADLYSLLVLDQISALLEIHPKHADGTLVDMSDPADYMSLRVDVDPATAGIQELKNWGALFSFVGMLPDGGGAVDVGNIPSAVYGPGGVGLGRQTVN